MNTYSVFLKGVNVGGNNMVKMADLRVHLESVGFHKVKTYIQSGNIVFQSADDSVKAIEDKVMSEIEAKFGVRSQAVVRTMDELQAIVDGYPCKGREDVAFNHFGVMFMSGEPLADTASYLPLIVADPEEVFAAPRDFYVHFPNDIGHSKFSMGAVENLTGRKVTFRNWNSINKVLEMAKSLA